MTVIQFTFAHDYLKRLLIACAFLLAILPATAQVIEGGKGATASKKISATPQLHLEGAEVISIAPGNNAGFAIIDVPKLDENDTISNHWDGRKYEFMINGGYYDDQFSPVGLCRINGRYLSRKKSKKLSGFVVIDEAGKLQLLTQKDHLKPYPTVLQSGPYIIDPGGSIGIHPPARIKARRTCIGATTDGTILIIITKPIALYDLAVIVKRDIPDIERLLNLDGGPSTALKTDATSVINPRPVRNFIAKKLR